MRTAPRTLRTSRRRAADFLTFPFRALLLGQQDRAGLSCRRSERFDYVARETRGYTLDVGCGRNDLFVCEYLHGNGKGIDVFRYEGLAPDQIVEDMTRLPFDDESFDTATFIANINHIPEDDRDAELAEAYRCLRRGGNIVVQMGNPAAELLVHRLVHFYDRILGTNLDMDSERGMHEDEEYFLRDGEILERLGRAGFNNIQKKYFWTQWGLNHLFVGWKR
jgi:SAM-dependent methyltransferase